MTTSTFGDNVIKKLTVTGAIVACVALGTAGCGDADPDATASAAPTRAEFIQRGDAVLCTKTEAVAAAMSGVDLESAGRAELKGLVFDGVLPAVETARDDLAALSAPAGSEGDLEGIISAMDDGIETTRSTPEQLLGGPDPFAAADRLIIAYGLTGCPA